MNISMSRRMNAFQESIFTELAQLKKSKISEGNDMIDLSIGSPDLPPPPFIVNELVNSVQDPALYGYSLKGTSEFQQAVSKYYMREYSVQLDSEEEVLLLMGSQDGLVHLPMALCNPGDYILVPDPGYTAYAAGVAMADAELYPMPLKKEHSFLPDFTNIPTEVCQKAKLMILNCPGNPVPAMATQAFFEQAVEFAREHNIVILHDFAYSELYYNKKPISFLSIEGAKDVGIEMNSLSKSFNMAGCRVAYAIGNKRILKMLGDLKSNLDYGVFYPIQAAASKALLDESPFLEENRLIYKHRRDLLVDGFHQLGWNITSPLASMFIWAEVPEGYTSKEFTLKLLHEANVVVTPGTAFGTWGEGYVRIALVQPEERLKLALSNMKKSQIFSNSVGV
ncbi:LL-diaminopimelate aminotransferase [Cytobacillus sp. FJAT-54145]|uniref:Aminotransferase n=1 Tax=Cytobacillus spartinae TaxID=3299023 RepID=A0ABW6KEI7_9BACI